MSSALQLYVLTEDEGGTSVPVVQYFTSLLYSLTFDTGCFLDIGERDMVMPGEDAESVFLLFYVFCCGIYLLLFGYCASAWGGGGD